MTLLLLVTVKVLPLMFEIVPAITGWPLPAIIGDVGFWPFSALPLIVPRPGIRPSRIIVAVTLVPVIVPCTMTVSPTAIAETVLAALALVTLALVASTEYVVVAGGVVTGAVLFGPKLKPVLPLTVKVLPLTAETTPTITGFIIPATPEPSRDIIPLPPGWPLAQVGSPVGGVVAAEAKTGESAIIPLKTNKENKEVIPKYFFIYKLRLSVKRRFARRACYPYYYNYGQGLFPHNIAGFRPKLSHENA